MFRVRAPLSLVAVFLVVAVVAAVFIGGRLIQDWNIRHEVPAGETYETQVAQLEARPLHLPALAKAQDCKSGPSTPPNGDFGSGPVHAYGNFAGVSDWGSYYANTVYTDRDIAGPIVVRGIDLFTRAPVIFIGDYAAGPATGTDTFEGQTYSQHTEILVNSANSTNAGAGHAHAWQFRAGVPKNWSGSTGWQIDGIGFSEVFLVC